MTSTPDYRSFPRNEMGEPLMDGAAYRYEQSLDAEYDAQGEDFYERMEREDISDDPDYCDYHDAVHRTPAGKTQCREEQDENIDPHDGTIYPKL